MTDIAHLALEMQQGRFPDWSPKLIMRLGEKLQETLDQHGLLMDSELQPMLDDWIRLRQILIDFGALSKEDHTTGVLDIVEILLPPMET